MSGVEIVEKIQQETKGKWRPSPGSIYPLLFVLQQKGFTIESSKNKGGMKQYALTTEGTKFTIEQAMLGQEIMEKMRCHVSIFIEGFHLGKPIKTRFLPKNPQRDYANSYRLDARKNKLIKENIDEITQLLDETNVKLTKIINMIDLENKRDSKWDMVFHGVKS